MNIVDEKWYEVSDKYCEHYDVGNGHCGEIKKLKKDAPAYAREMYAERIKLWKKQGKKLPKDANEYL